ncbi:hypothetical protein HMPREF9123_1490 [Neisseria bacilliformis ATCC BAA-1200]|uniref:Uncharacterized protein n=1 Tax=Neisseria bacilliformis ATCC BAA-1200 TaxID=888742 RepID=F2BCK2_9NEIS|nr:hypothetical protein HMPREF9123_1490 [Neisseria bacilliformis ATCC BAA-1200]
MRWGRGRLKTWFGRGTNRVLCFNFVETVLSDGLYSNRCARRAG